MITTILVPLDGSTHAAMALELAADLAAGYGARLVLLHVGFRGGGDVPRDLEEGARREFEAAERAGQPTSEHPTWPRHHQILEFLGRRILDDARQVASGRGVQSIEPVLDFGETGERILHWANHAPADVIVMGTRGYSELEGLFLGSVSHKVYHLAKCPCITVRQVGARTGFEGIRTIVVPTDGSLHARRAVELASDIAARHGARMIFLHMLQRRAGVDALRRMTDLERLSEAARRELDPNRQAGARLRAGYDAMPVPQEVLEEIGRQVLDAASDAARQKGVQEIATVLEDGDAARHILACARRDGADLIVMGNRGLGEMAGLLAGSVSNKVVHLAECACMTVR